MTRAEIGAFVLYVIISFTGRGQTDDCTSGFTSVDRIDAVLGNYGSVFISFPDFSAQVIVPDTTFTCNGSILSWTFGARWEGNSETLTELQIWRSSGDGYPLSSTLPFQAGDILGYFQPATSTSQLGLYHEEVSTINNRIVVLASPASQFNISGTSVLIYQPMIDVETGNHIDLSDSWSWESH